jgi:tetratricopeptide (TPR) repeat protein
LEHLRFEDYLAVLQGERSFSTIDRRAHQHLLDLCPDCRGEWHRFDTTAQGGELVAVPGDPQLPVPPNLAADERHVSLTTVDVVDRLLVLSREAARFAREDLNRLLRLPVDAWAQRVAAARTRFRSRAFAELLIEESRRRVRTAAEEAVALTELVPIALSRLRTSGDRPWSQALRLRATAHRANALRVAGDLPAASAAFAALRRDAGSALDADPNLRAEIHSLEASLRLDQRQLVQAKTLLASAGRAYSLAGDHTGLARTLIKQANLEGVLGRPDEILPLLDRAATLFNPSDDHFLHFCTVHARVNALLDLDRITEAAALLTAERRIYLEDGDDYTAIIHRFMRSRVDLGLGRLAEAEAGLAATRDLFLALDRDYDAILTSLYLADALLAAGKTAELRDLAASLVPLFRSRGVEREALASLRLLAEAARTDTLTAALLAQLRRRLRPTDAAAT